ncbi:hypothetical protein ABT299_47815 [Spirillospora sp. NPDC000708]
MVGEKPPDVLFGEGEDEAGPVLLARPMMPDVLVPTFVARAVKA